MINARSNSTKANVSLEKEVRDSQKKRNAHRRQTTDTASSKLALKLMLIGLGLLFLLLLASCAASTRVVPQTLHCPAPETLDPTPEPVMQDQTNDELRREADRLRSSLRSANKDKADAQKFIQENC